MKLILWKHYFAQYRDTIKIMWTKLPVNKMTLFCINKWLGKTNSIISHLKKNATSHLFWDTYNNYLNVNDDTNELRTATNVYIKPLDYWPFNELSHPFIKNWVFYHHFSTSKLQSPLLTLSSTYSTSKICVEASHVGHFVMVSLWCASLSNNTRFRFVYFRVNNS